jgi:hypothetical protein
MGIVGIENTKDLFYKELYETTERILFACFLLAAGWKELKSLRSIIEEFDRSSSDYLLGDK